MMFLAMLAVGVWAAVSGPAWDDWRARRKAARDYPDAKVAFMLPSICDRSDQ